jgi:iron-sulfur cluster assembly protein
MLDDLIEEEPIVKITKTAAHAIKDAWNSEFKDNNYALRVGVRGGGCAGLSYLLDFATNLNEVKDDFLSEQYGVKIYVPTLAAPYLEGTVIDYVTSLQGMGFKFDNPNASTKCGCGSSFG